MASIEVGAEKVIAEVKSGSDGGIELVSLSLPLLFIMLVLISLLFAGVSREFDS
jgi:hypothetical protein